MKKLIALVTASPRLTAAASISAANNTANNSQTNVAG